MTNKKAMGASEEGDSCCKKLEVPSEEEVVALNAMRAIKARVRELKKRLSAISSSRNEGDRVKAIELEKRMETLRAEWNEWENKRKKAAAERMILLGHEE